MAEATTNQAANGNNVKPVNLLLEAAEPIFFGALLPIMRSHKFFDRTTDVGLMNPNDGSSISLKENTISEASSMNTSNKTIGEGVQQQNVVQSMEQRFITNRMRIDSDEFILNSHKLNPWLWEYADYKSNPNQWGESGLVGNFCLFGTVMVKAWDHQMGKYVLMRRLARMPMFGPLLDVPKIAEGLDIPDDSERVNNYPAKQATESAKNYYARVAQQFAQSKTNQQNTAPNGTTPQQTGNSQNAGSISDFKKLEEAATQAINKSAEQITTNTQANTTNSSADHDKTFMQQMVKEASSHGIGAALRDAPSAKEIAKSVANTNWKEAFQNAGKRGTK